MKKIIYFSYAVVCYSIFFVTFLYLICFVENISLFNFAAPLKNLFPKTLDFGTSPLKTLPAVFTDLLLITLFGLQHSIMARKGFKEKWTKIIPRPVERSTFVLFTSIVLITMFYFWQPVSVIIYDFNNTNIGSVLFFISMLGWTGVLITTFLINHFDLFGLRQVFLYARNKESGHINFRTPLYYKFVRHPIYLGFLVAFWFTPVMTLGHMIFIIGMTTYIFIGIYHEEKDLVKLFGNQYEDYRMTVPKIIPFGRNSKNPELWYQYSQYEGEKTNLS